MEYAATDVARLPNRLLWMESPAGMEARVLSSCRSRLYEASRIRRRNAVRVAAACALANIALSVIALRRHQRHVRLKASLYES